MLKTEILNDLIDLMEEYERLFEASKNPRKSIEEFCDTVISSGSFVSVQKKYGLGTGDVQHIITCMLYVRPTYKCLSEIKKIIEDGRTNGPIMETDEKASNAYSAWAHNKASAYAVNFTLEEDPFKKGQYHGQELAYRDAACMFDVLTTRRKHLPPEIKPYLEKEGAL